MGSGSGFGCGSAAHSGALGSSGAQVGGRGGCGQGRRSGSCQAPGVKGEATGQRKRWQGPRATCPCSQEAGGETAERLGRPPGDPASAPPTAMGQESWVPDAVPPLPSRPGPVESVARAELGWPLPEASSAEPASPASRSPWAREVGFIPALWEVTWEPVLLPPQLGP